MSTLEQNIEMLKQKARDSWSGGERQKARCTLVKLKVWIKAAQDAERNRIEAVT